MTLAEELQRELDEIRQRIERLWLAVMRAEKLAGVEIGRVN